MCIHKSMQSSHGLSHLVQSCGPPGCTPGRHCFLGRPRIWFFLFTVSSGWVLFGVIHKCQKNVISSKFFVSRGTANANAAHKHTQSKRHRWWNPIPQSTVWVFSQDTTKVWGHLDEPERGCCPLLSACHQAAHHPLLNLSGEMSPNISTVGWPFLASSRSLEDAPSGILVYKNG